MKHVNQNDDLKLVVQMTDREGSAINPADHNYTLIFFTRRYDNLQIEVRKDVPLISGVNIEVDSDYNIHVSIANPNFAPGELILETIVEVQDESFPDKTRKVSSGEMHTNVYVDEPAHIGKHGHTCGCCADINITATLYDYTLQAVIDDAKDAIKKANDAAEKADESAADLETIKEEAITATEAANDATTKAVAATKKANDAAVSADTAKTNADTATDAAKTATTDAVAATKKANDAAASADTATANADTATEAANDATTKAVAATSAALGAAASAVTAKNDADAATEAAETATTDAVAATKKANDAAALADTATANADTATEAAKTATTETIAATEAAKTATGATNAATSAANTAANNANQATAAVEDVLSDAKETIDNVDNIKNAIAELNIWLETEGRHVIGFYRVRTESSPNVTYIVNQGDTSIADLFKMGVFDENGVLKKQFADCSMTEDRDGNAVAIDGTDGDVMNFTTKPIYGILGRYVGDLTVYLFSDYPFVYKGIVSEKFARYAKGVDFGVVYDNKLRHIYNPTVRGNYAATVGLAEEFYSDGYGWPTRAISQYQGMLYCRNRNPDANRNFPFMLPMTYMNEIKAALVYHETGTMYLTNPAVFGSGMTMQNTCNINTFDDDAMTASGGVKVTINDKSVVVGFTTTLFQVNSVNKNMIDLLNWTNICGLQMMEGQRALAYAKKNDIAEGVKFKMDDSPSNVEYKYRSVPNCKGLKDNVMTGVVFKYVTMHTKSDGSVTMLANNTTLGLSAGDVVNNTEILYQLPIPIYRGEVLYGDRFSQHVGLGLICHNEATEDNPLIGDYGANYYEIRQTHNWRQVPVYTNSTVAAFRTDGSAFGEENYDLVGYMPRGEGWSKETFDGCPSQSSVRGANVLTYESLYCWQSGTTSVGRKENKASVLGCSWYYAFASVRTCYGPYSVTSGYYSYAASSAVPDLELAETEAASRQA